MIKEITESVTTTTEVTMTDDELDALIIEHLGLSKEITTVRYDISENCIMGCTATSHQITNGEGE